MNDKWTMQVSHKDNFGRITWNDVHPTGGSPYLYDTETEATDMLSKCYPDSLRQERLGGDGVVRVHKSTL